MNQKGFANIVLILIIVAVIAVGGYFVFSKKSVTPTNTSISNQAANNNEMANKPSIAPSQKTIDSNEEIEFTFSAPKGAVQSKIYLSCESGMYAYFSDNITPRTPTPYQNICNTWQENTWDTVQPDPALVRDIRDIKFRNDTTQGKVATLQMTVTMSNSLVLKSDLSRITINPTSSTSSSGTVDWKTYTNEKYGFGLKYPPDLSFKNSGETNPGVTPRQWWVTFEKANQKGSLELLVTENTPVDIYAKTVSLTLSGNRKTEQVMIGTKKGILFDGSYEGALSTDVLTPIGNHQLRIQFNSIGDDTFYSDRSLINQILSTFKFADSQAKTAPSNASSAASMAVAGMSKYTDSDFGFSFWYPSSWKVVQVPVESPDAQGWFQEGAVIGRLDVANPNPSNNRISSVIIQKFRSSSRAITELGATKSASPVGVDIKIYFDTNKHAWMWENLTVTPKGDPPGIITAVDVSSNTMGGLHIFPGARRFGAETIIPLSARDFLVISSEPGYETSQNYLAKTIVATDPSVATPVSANEQSQIIRQEAVIYGAIGTPVGDDWYKDNQHVYDSKGIIIPGANSKTFAPIDHFSDGYTTTHSNYFATDGVHVYSSLIKEYLVQDADPATFVMIRQEYQFKDLNSGQQRSFNDINFQKDKSHVWLNGRLIPGADPNTFVVTGDTLAKDAHHVYSRDHNGNIAIDGVSIK